MISAEAVVKEEKKGDSSFFDRFKKSNDVVYKLGTARNEALKKLENNANK